MQRQRLPKLKLLAGIARADAARIARAVRRRELAAGEVYVRYRAALPGFCFLADGSLILRFGRGTSRRVFRIVAPRESFCEAPALLQAPSPFEVRAQRDSVVLAVPVALIHRLAKRRPAFASALIRLLAQRAMLALADLDDSTVPVAERVAAYLGSIARATASGEWHAVLPMSKTVLAGRMGMKKETLSRALRRLADDGLISFTQRDFIIKDLKRLRDRGT